MHSKEPKKSDIKSKYFADFFIFIFFVMGIDFDSQVKTLDGGLQDLYLRLRIFINNPKASKLSLKTLLQRYLLLRDICCGVNDTFGIPILLSITAVCLEVTYCMFASYMTDLPSVSLICAAWALLHVIPVIGVMTACQHAENSVSLDRTFLKHVIFNPNHTYWPVFISVNL